MPHRHETPVRALAALSLLLGAFLMARALGGFWTDLEGAGHVGIVALPAAAALAAILLARRSTSLDGAAIGLATPAALFALAELPLGRLAETPIDRVPGIALVVGTALASCACIASTRREGDAARVRIAISSLFVAMLVPLLLTTIFSAPHGFTIRGRGPAVPPSPQLMVATLLASIALVQLQRRRTSALGWIVLLAVAIDTSPTWGEVSCGCMECPGPIEWLGLMPVELAQRWMGTRVLALPAILLAPPLVPILALAPWLGPAWRWLRA